MPAPIYKEKEGMSKSFLSFLCFEIPITQQKEDIQLTVFYLWLRDYIFYYKLS